VNFNLISIIFNFNVEVWGLVKIKTSRCLEYFHMLAQKADMNPRDPLAGSVVCLGNSNRALVVLFGPAGHHKGPNNRFDAHCAHFSSVGELRFLC
jgi:hypothetical protein